MQKWNILIIECSDIVVKGICSFLQEINTIGQINIEPNFKAALKLVDDNHYDLILLNLCIHNYAGFEFLERLLTHKPKSNILTFSDCCTFVYALRAFKIGAKGYFATNILGAEFVKAVESTAVGNKYMDVSLAQKIALQMINGENNPCNQLTTREFEVFRLQAKGLDSHQIAAQLCISYKTACNYTSKIREKLNVQNTVQLMSLAREYGIICHDYSSSF